MGRVQHPGAALCAQVFLYAVESWISLVHLQLTEGTIEISSTVLSALWGP